MTRYIPIILALMVTGCGTPLGLALGAAGSSAVSFVSTGVKDDIAQAAIWRSGHQVLVSQCEGKLMLRVDDLAKADFDETLARCNKLLAFSVEQQPKILAARLKGHYDRAKAPSVVPEPKVVAPAGPLQGTKPKPSVPPV